MSAGEDLRLECEVSEAGEVVWLKGTERIQPSRRIQVLCQGRQHTLVIRGFSAEDQGEYRCGPAVDPASAGATTFHGASASGSRVRGWRTEGEPWGMPVGVGVALHAEEPSRRVRLTEEVHRPSETQPQVRTRVTGISGHTPP